MQAIDIAPLAIYRNQDTRFSETIAPLQLTCKQNLLRQCKAINELTFMMPKNSSSSKAIFTEVRHSAGEDHDLLPRTGE